MRYDKYDGMVGGFRAPLDFDVAEGEEFKAYAVGLNANGRVVKGAGNTGILAVMIPHGPKMAGDVVDNMTDGDIVNVEGMAAGTVVWGDNTSGEVSATGDAGTATRLGTTVEATRLVVRV